MYANIAESVFIKSRLEYISFALIIAERRQDEKAGLMMKQEDALFAAKNLDATNTKNNDIVPKSVPVRYVRIKAIRPVGIEPVYNMEVDEYHNFAINGGVIVHNCMDSMRYYVQTILRREIRSSGI